MNNDSPLTPTEFVAGFNQLIEYNVPTIVIEGEVVEFRVSKNRWVYFNIADSQSSVACFGTVYQIKSPIEEGMMIRLMAVPRLHNKFGFSLNVLSIMPVGEGALKRSAEILKAKLGAEGLFNPDRKRALPYAPQKIGLVTSEGSAAYHDFIKILDERWCGVEVVLSDVLVQGENAVESITNAIQKQNQTNTGIEVLVITRGGGSAEDLMVFNDERLVRAIAGSRVPTLTAIGHEVDESLAELASDIRASTPSNAVSFLVPDKSAELTNISAVRKHQLSKIQNIIDFNLKEINELGKQMIRDLKHTLSLLSNELHHFKLAISALNPNAVLKRGYSILSSESGSIKTVKNVKHGQKITNILLDGKIISTVEGIE